MSDNFEFLTKDLESKCEFFNYSLEIWGKGNTMCRFCIPEENESNLNFTKLKTDTIGKYKRTIALWTDKKNQTISSVNFDEPINKETDR